MVLVGSIRRGAPNLWSLSWARCGRAKNLSRMGQLFFYPAADGRLVAACGFGSPSTIAKEYASKMMISRRLAPRAEGS